MNRFVLAALLAALCSCRDNGVKITSLNPEIGEVGETLKINGSDFGAVRGESFVTFGSVRATQSSYLKWTDNLIEIRVPDFGESALVYVVKGDKKSNPVLFSTQENMPVFPEKTSASALAVNEVDPKEGSVGALISIRGANFGAKAEGGFVVFDSLRENSAPDSMLVPGNVAGLANQSAYITAGAASGLLESWAPDEIKLYVPDGAASGQVIVVQGNEKSAGASFNVRYIGDKKFKNKKTYAITYSVDVRVNKAALPNSIMISLPEPANTAFQIKKELLSSSTKPFMSDYKGTALYKLSDLKDNSTKEVTVSYLVESYATETRIDSKRVRTKSSGDKNFLKPFTSPTVLIDSGGEEVKAKIKKIIGRETNPYLIARLIYKSLLAGIKSGQDSPAEAGATAAAGASGKATAGASAAAKAASAGEAAAETKEAPSASPSKSKFFFDKTIEFCSLCRASGIAAIPIGGVIVTKNRVAVPHQWAAFWLDDFGWVPVDLVFGSGLTPEGVSEGDLTRPEELSTAGRAPEDYYFGNSDNNRIVFSFGETILFPININGKVSSIERGYAIQNIWEESTNSIESYSSNWSNIEITGVY